MDSVKTLYRKLFRQVRQQVRLFPVAPLSVWALVCLGFTGCHASTDPETPSPLTFPAIVAAQVGYPTWATKTAAAVSLTQLAFGEIDVVDTQTGTVVAIAHNDAAHPSKYFPNLKQWVTLVDFSALTRPGQYVLSCQSPKVASFPFRIEPNPYQHLASYAAKMLYYQRVGVDLDQQHAGQWSHTAWHTSAQLSALPVAKWPGGSWLNLSDTIIDPGPYKVSGGWYDAGDADLYSKNEANMTDALIFAYDWIGNRVSPAALQHNGLPESGNGIPDLINEALVGAMYLQTAQDPTHAEFDRLLCGDPNAPILKLAQPCSGATLCAVTSLAMAAAVLNEHHWHPAQAASLLLSAKESWALLQSRPAVWPVDGAGKPVPLGSIDWSYGDESAWRALAAAALYRATGDESLGEIAKGWLDNCGAPRISGAELAIFVADNIETRDGADSPSVRAFAARMLPDADNILSNLQLPLDRMAYGSGSRDGCFWGSTGSVSGDAWEMAWVEEHVGRSPGDAAVNYLCYLLGRNPERYCYVTNLQALGATYCMPVIYSFQAMHSRWPSTNGIVISPPGYLVGGPTDSTESMPNISNAENDWEHFEPSIMYQQSFIILTSYCAYGARH